MDVKRYLPQKTPIGNVMKESPEGYWVLSNDFDRILAERDALQQLLNARDEEITSLRADAERYQWMKANVRNGSFGTDTGWIDDDTEQWDCDIDIKRGVLIPEWRKENQA